MKIYIAGKISGDPDYKRKFFATQKLLEKSGHTVLTPAMLPEGMDKEEYMRICFSMIDVSDIVMFLEDWKESPGARLEHSYCEYIEKAVAYFSGEISGQDDMAVACANIRYAIKYETTDTPFGGLTVVRTDALKLAGEALERMSGAKVYPRGGKPCDKTE